MPLYEYECPSCAKRFDELRRLSEREDDAVCPACASPGARPVLGVPAPSPGGATRCGQPAATGCARRSGFT